MAHVDTALSKVQTPLDVIEGLYSEWDQFVDATDTCTGPNELSLLMRVLEQEEWGLAIEILINKPKLAEERTVRFKWTSLLLAATHSAPIELLDKLHEEAPENLEWETSHGLRPLAAAAVHNNIAGVKWLISKGAKLDYPTKGLLPITGAGKWANPETIKTLIALGANINAKDGYNQTALMWAAFEDNAPAIKSLLAYKPDMTLKNKEGKTALDIAIEAKSKKAIALLKKGLVKKVVKKKTLKNNGRS